MIEKHDSHRFRILLDVESAQGGDRHQEIFIEQLAILDVQERAPHDVVACNQIRSHKQCQRNHSTDRCENCRQQNPKANNQTDDGFPDFILIPFTMRMTMSMAMLFSMIGSRSVIVVNIF
ncbi:hypothetical protein SDC9_133678 [bioreactor metagenome]|uniref:Uncharacterized protein n=1 Tax=bioreactor metagenome TaxID=1076179 RepID=A0A645DC52_9ZZZZ